MVHDTEQTVAVNAAAEEILRLIYGDDLAGCAVRPEAIASVMLQAIQPAGLDREMLGLYERAVEALHLLSTPPANPAGLKPEEMPALLGDRLDAIHRLTGKLLETAAASRTQTFSEPP